MKTWKYFIFFIVIAGPLLIFENQAHAESNSDKTKIIVKYQPSDTTTDDQKVLSEKPDIKVINVSKDQAHSELKKLNQQKNVDYAELDTKVYLMDSPVNDPYLDNQSQVFQDIHLYDAWKQFSPKGNVTVAVVDSGIDLQHPDLQSEIIDGYNELNPGALPIDNIGHGTHVAGMIGALTDNQFGIASPSKGVNIMPIKVMDGDSGQLSDVINGIIYAVDHHADIINLSLGIYSNMESLKDAIDYATSKGVLVIASAGNDGEDTTAYPAAYDNVLAVGATNTNTNLKASFSNYGSKIDVAAPGTSIFSTWINNSFQSEDGTSMATSIVTSVAALIKKQMPMLTSGQIEGILENTASPIAGSNQVGKGLINADTALNYIDTKDRISGQTPLDTAINISKQGWSKLDNYTLSVNGKAYNGKFVILATGNNFPDSLAGGELAHYLNCPILLNESNHLTKENLEEMNRLNANYVVILGSTDAVSANVETELKQNGIESIRISGADRYETDEKIMQVIPSLSHQAIIVTGEKFPDMLSAATEAAYNKDPILYVKKDYIPPEVSNYIKQHITSTVIVGSTDVISNDIMNQLPDPIRIAGSNRYETNEKVIEYFKPTASQVMFVQGENYQDDLTIGAYSAKFGAPIVLTEPNQVRGETVGAINFLNQLGYDHYTILGSPDTIGLNTAWALDRLLGQ